jgi:hypothetical protein
VLLLDATTRAGATRCSARFDKTSRNNSGAGQVRVACGGAVEVKEGPSFFDVWPRERRKGDSTQGTSRRLRVSSEREGAAADMCGRSGRSSRRDSWGCAGVL